MAMGEKVLIRCAQMKKDLDSGMAFSAAKTKNRLSGTQWKDFNTHSIEARPEPEIQTHDLDEGLSPQALYQRKRRAKLKEPAPNTVNKCVVILTNTDNLSSVVEGLLR